MYSAYYSHVVKAEKVGEREVKFVFDAPGNRELPQIVGQLTVPAEALVGGTDAQGRKRDVSATTLEMPLGSGPYRVKEFVAGRSIALERVKDYWGRDFASQCGPQQFRRDALRVFPRRHRGDRGFQGRSGRLGAPRTARRTGQRPTTSRP
jgi:microcin C transport system substrate-binding protein